MLFTQKDLRTAYTLLLKRGQHKVFTPQAFQGNVAGLICPQQQSLLSVGSDGFTTRQLANNPDLFFNEIERLLNQCEPGTDIPRLNFKKYLVVEKFNQVNKMRKIVKLCLRDQVIMRVVLKKLMDMNIVCGDYNPTVNVLDLVTGIHQDMRSRTGKYNIIRTDIQNFYPSVNIDLLLHHFKENCCTDPETMGIYHLLRKALRDNKSQQDYTGLPVGMCVSTLLGEYYFMMAGLHQLPDGIKLYRFADDCLFILEEGIDAQLFLDNLKQKLISFNLLCSATKTFIVEKGMPIDFIGVHFENGIVSIDEAKKRKTAERIKTDIEKEFKYFRLLKSNRPEYKMPENKAIVRRVLKEHQNGTRSRMTQHAKKIELLNEL